MEDEQLQGQRSSTRALADPERDGLEYPLHVDSARPPTAIGMNPDDGMPQPIPGIALKDSLAPRLTPERFVCMADTSAFVIRGPRGTIAGHFDPSIVERDADGKYRVHWSKVHVDVIRATSKNLLRGMKDATISERLEEQGFLEVEPIRPQCKHYMRQLMPWPDDPERKLCQRYCSALKNDQGELLSVSNTELLACELREPRDYKADEQIDEFDKNVMYMGEIATKEKSEFDITAELAKDNLGVLGG